MRCISPHAGYSIQVFEGNEQVVMDARGYASTVVLQKPVIANFQQGGLLDHEIGDALEYFNFSGLPDGVNPLTRVASFDTEAYVEQFPEKAKGDKPGRSEMLVQIDDRLRELQARHPNEFIIVEQPQSPRPWPSYDTDDAEFIVRFQERLQVDPQVVRLYEVENQNRDEIVSAMEKLERTRAGLPPEQEIVVNA
jgi:hypothetical protein